MEMTVRQFNDLMKVLKDISASLTILAVVSIPTMISIIIIMWALANR